LRGEDKQMDLFETIDIIFNLVLLTGVSVTCIVGGFIEFHRTYPTRYGKNHIELKGKVVGKEEMKVGRFRRIVMVPVVQFNWKETSYEIADRTHYLFTFTQFEVGDNVIVCYNPSKNEDIVIIKEGTFDYEVISSWLVWFIIALIGYIGILFGLLALVI